MLIGITASAKALAPPPPPPIDPYYVGAVAILDFENGVYMINGVTKTAGQMISQSDRIVAGGLDLNWGSDGPSAKFSADVMAAIPFNDGWTSFVSAYVRQGTSMQTLMAFGTGNGSTGDKFYTGNDIGGVYTSESRRPVGGPTVNRTVYDNVTLNSVVLRDVKYAVTNKTTRLSSKLNAGTLQGSNTLASSSLTYATGALGGYGYETWLDCNALFRKVIFYPAIADELLGNYTAP